jgi:hypothetical protein
MRKSFWIIVLAAIIVLPVAIVGCKGKTETPQEMPPAMMEGQDMINPSAIENTVTTEPSQTVATETIPPTAAPEIAVKPVTVSSQTSNRAKDIQRALKNAGFYAGAIDGKIGPKTKKAIEDFQRAKELVVDGKVGPRTWAELESYLAQ